MTPQLPIHDAGLMPYQPAWDLQLSLHAQVLDGMYPLGIIMLVEHPPVITVGRRLNAQSHLLASPSFLATRGVAFVESDRGGDITFHGPGQIVAYPILPLNVYNLNLHNYMRFLEEVVIQTLATFQISAFRDPTATGVWVPPSPLNPSPAKICALGVKLRRWVTFHGLALNVTTDLSYFSLINPCGLSRPVTSLHQLLGPQTPSLQQVKNVLAAQFRTLLPAPLPAPKETGPAS